jgi:hypothetical protein
VLTIHLRLHGTIAPGPGVAMKMSEWRAERNRKALARLERALPDIFPATVLAHALRRPFTPPTPRLAVDAYWRAHVVRADRLARALAGRSGAPAGWTWRLATGRKSDQPNAFRLPPAPYREQKFSRGPGFCCVCGQPVYRLGWHADLWDAGRNRNAAWHAVCVIAWDFWNGPSEYGRQLKKMQARRCGESGRRLLKTAEVDHRLPLFRVWQEHRDKCWPALLDFWGLPNLQVINREVHVAKCAAEASYRSLARLEL